MSVAAVVVIIYVECVLESIYNIERYLSSFNTSSGLVNPVSSKITG
jgi:hypothetical protein